MCKENCDSNAHSGHSRLLVRLSFSVGFVVLACLLLTQVGYTAPQGTPPQFRSGVNVIQFDARVLDSEGRPVRGLTASDFVVLEEGQPRPIAAFSEVALPNARDDARPGLDPVSPDVVSNEVPEGRLLVMVIDDAMIPPNPAMVAASKAIARAAIERMGPSDRMSVVFTRDNRNAQDFTSDRHRLLHAVEQTSIGFIFAGPFKSTKHFWQASLSTLLNVAEALSNLQARRKAIIYISIGLPYELAETELLSRWRSLSQSALGSNTAIYSFDPTGAGGLDAFFASQPLIKPIERPPNLKLFPTFLEELSANTGGRASLLVNGDHGSRLNQMYEDTSSYYWLGYESAFPIGDGRFRRLEVKTRRADLRVIARTGHFSREPDDRSRKTVSGPAERAITSPIHGGDISMQASAAPFAFAPGGTARVAVVTALRHLVTGDVREHVVDLVIAVFEHGDRRRQSQHHTARLRLRPDPDDGTARYEIPVTVDLKPGRYRLRIGAHNRELDKSGSVFVDVDVPDFTADPLSLSGLILAGSSDAASAQAGLADLIPLVPTTRRHFQQADRPVGFVRVYQSTKAQPESAEMVVRVFDVLGRVMHEQISRLGPERFGRSGASFQFVVPTSGLSTGEYRLDVDAIATSAKARRQLRFRVE
jgi:VWFA-related protein